MSANPLDRLLRRWVNVNIDEVVNFDAGGIRFAWRFDGPGWKSFDLRRRARQQPVAGRHGVRDQGAAVVTSHAKRYVLRKEAPVV